MNHGTAALARGLQTLCALSEEDGLGVVELASRVGGDKSQLSRTLATLEEHGFVVRDGASQAFRLGPRLAALAARARESRLLAEAPPAMRALVREFGESVHLSVRQADQVLTLHSESPAAALHAPGRVGSLTPLAGTATGRALALDLGPDELAELGLPQPVIATARARGYAIVREEFEPGLVAAAAPVRDAAGHIVAALNISGPAFRLDDRLEPAARRIAETAASLSG